MGVVTDQKANTSLTKLDLEYNKVGDAGTAALADALQATILTCKKCVFRACVRCHRKCLFTSRLQWASSTFFGNTRCVLCNFLVSCRKTFTQVMWHRVRVDLHQNDF